MAARIDVTRQQRKLVVDFLPEQEQIGRLRLGARVQPDGNRFRHRERV
jgi:hypothetical protein